MKAAILKFIIIFLLITLISYLSAIFIEQYCRLFNHFGLMAKLRLLSWPYWGFLITPLSFWLSAYLCRFYAPHASGSGLEHIKYCLKKLEKEPGYQVDNFLSLRIVIIASISSLIASFGGGALGREGPSVLMSASLFAAFGQKLRFLLSMSNWILAGSALGVAIAFNAPLAGLVYGLEKLIRLKIKLKNAWAVPMAIIIIMIILQGTEPLFPTSALNFKFNQTIILMLLIAVICGLIALIIKKINHYFYNKIANIKSALWHLMPIIAGLLVAIISIYAGIYSFSGGITTASHALSSPDILLGYPQVGGRILNMILTFTAGCAGGLVAPAIAIGTGIGSIASAFMPDSPTDIFLLIGMVAFLSAMMDEPLTATIVVFETTSQSLSALPFLLITAFIAALVARLVFNKNHGFKLNRSRALDAGL